MNKLIISSILCCVLLFSFQTIHAEEELPLPEGKNIKEWEAISVALVSENRISEAIVYLDKILDEEPDNLKAMPNKAGLLIQLGKFFDRVELSDKVLQLDSDRVSALTNKAIALKMLKEYERSFLTFTEILIIDPSNEKIEKARANLLSGTPTRTTTNSEYDVHILVTVRNSEGQLIATTESTNSRFLDSIFTESWWNKLVKAGEIKVSDETQMYTHTGKIIPQHDQLGFVHLQRQMSGYDVNIFETFFPMIPIDEGDTGMVQWTILKK